LAYHNVLYHARKRSYPFSTMATREELKVLIDQLPEPRLEAVRKMLEHHVHPPPSRPEIKQMQLAVSGVQRAGGATLPRDP